jgi:LIVCS family branched-chain amino acid:cation transporter
MQSSKKVSIWIVGLALFSMFFGAGNLIFPLSIGQMGQDQYFWGLAGFLVTGVLLPFLGVITMVVYNGDYTAFFGSLGKRWGFLFTLILLTVWIPLGSSPRCITLAYVNMKSYLGGMPLWTYSLIYCALLFPLSYKKSRALDILGYVLTPLLLICLLITVVQGLRLSPGMAVSAMAPGQLVGTGLLEGYNTMDLIASFFFTSTVIATLREAVSGGTDSKGRSVIQVALRSCAIGVVVLAIVYVGLMAVAAANAEILVNVPKDELLARLVTVLLGPQLRIVATTAVVLACLTTSIALIIVYADFLTQSVFKGKVSNLTSISLTLAATFGMSILGFQGISNFTGPLLEIFYPCLLGLIVWNLGIKRAWAWYQGRSLPEKSTLQPAVGE